MSLAKFGPFTAVFAKGELSVPGHMKLLGLRDESAQIVIKRIEAALSAEDPRPWVAALFDDPNWRPHLVGAIALVLDDGKRLDQARLWSAMDAGSWVTPQLAVTAYFVDPSFPERLRQRVSQGCAVTLPAGLSPLERHSFTGPADAGGRSAKLLASLLTIGAYLPSLRSELEIARSLPENAELLAGDVDHSPRITEAWYGRLVEQFALRGRGLKPKAA